MSHIKFKTETRLIIRLLLIVLLFASLSANIFFLFIEPKSPRSYLQNEDQIYIMEAGILRRNLYFSKGAELVIKYDFVNERYADLIDRYGIAEIAGDGTELDKAIRLMDAFSGRLKHLSNYDNHVEMNAVSLLDYSLDNKKHGINCRSKAQILNEMCLALGIYSRKVWILPISEYDDDCHVVNEIWDSALYKWVMLDITNNEYWIDINGVPLSILEIRRNGADMEFCTPVVPGEDTDSPRTLKKKHMDDFLYIMKNMVYMRYCETYTADETAPYALLPVGIKDEFCDDLSEDSVTRPPFEPGK